VPKTIPSANSRAAPFAASDEYARWTRQVEPRRVAARTGLASDARDAADSVKTVKNRLHLDIQAGGEWTDPIEARRKRVDAEATRLAGLGATITGALSEEGLDHYARPGTLLD
jgi:hypothetical protein